MFLQEIQKIIMKQRKYFKFKRSFFQIIIYTFLLNNGFISSLVLADDKSVINSENFEDVFFNIIKDGSDGSIRFSTILSIDPYYLVKIKNARNNYNKILLIGDYCFRK